MGLYLGSNSCSLKSGLPVTEDANLEELQLISSPELQIVTPSGDVDGYNKVKVLGVPYAQVSNLKGGLTVTIGG